MRRMAAWLILTALLATACLPTAPVTPTAPRTPRPTWTLPFGPSATPGSATPTLEPSLTPSPTARPGIDPTLGPFTPNPYITPATPIPEPMPQLHLDRDIVNILLLGRDTARTSTNYRTDVMIVASINKTARSVTLLTLPRDLYVYIPGWTMNRLNVAAAHGDAIDYPGGGVALLEQTILYNLGIPLHGWARVDFDGFKEVVDIFDGVDVPVTCAMQDWRMKDPALDQQDPDNWELYTVETGVQPMDGDMALWYARSRKHSSDFDRSRRQHQVLRALFDKALQLNLITKVPQLYQQYVDIVDTDLGLGDLLQFVPLALELDTSRVKSRFIGRGQVYNWVTPTGGQVLLPDRAAVTALVSEAFEPPGKELAQAAPMVEIWNGTLHREWAVLAAENLRWAGYPPVLGTPPSTDQPTTTLFDFSTNRKDSARAALQDLFHISDANVVTTPDASAPYSYRIVLGADYDSCYRPAQAILPTPTPGAATEIPPAAPGDIHAPSIVEGLPPPQVDGDLTEWTYLPYPIATPTFGRENWSGPDDLSATWAVAWDEQYLYLALKVKDDTFVQTATGESLFKGDSLELLLDVDPAARGELLTDRDFQLGLSPGDLTAPTPAEDAFLWLPALSSRAIPEVFLGARLVSGGYHLEIAVPWTTFNWMPAPGQALGFALALNDDDLPGTALQQSQVSASRDRKLTDPRTWGILVLDAPTEP